MSLIRVLRQLDKQLNKKSYNIWDNIGDLWDDFVLWVGRSKLSTWCYNFKNFFRNLRIFIPIAWSWRCWDSTYSIDVFSKLLEEHARCLRDGSFVNSEKCAKRALIASKMLKNAYEDELHKDKTISYFHHKFPIRLENRVLIRDSTEIAEKIIRLAYKRIERVNKQKKKDAWDYINKYIETWWD